MRICYLHVGPHKTATTTIQTCLSINAAALAADGLYVPRMEVAGTKTFHHRFAVEMGHGMTTRCRERIAKELRYVGLPEKIVISSENFSAWIRLPEMRNRLTAFFTGLGYEIHVITYIRPQISAINSYYTQRIKTVHLDSGFDAFFESFLSTPQYNHLWRFQPVARDRNIRATFTPFSSEILRSGICQDFLKRLGMDRTSLPRYTYPAARNVSPGPKTIAAFLRVGVELAEKENVVPHDVQVFRASGLRRLTDSMGWDRSRFNGLTEEQKAILMAHFGEANEGFAQSMWNRSWREIFAADEDKALGQPRCVFDPDRASAQERNEFNAFCQLAVEVMARPLDPGEKGANATSQPAISAADAGALRHRRAQRRLRQRTAASPPA